MTISDKQAEMLNLPLDAKHVKEREIAKVKISYIEGWHVIAEANRIFGFGGWSRNTVYNNEVSRVETTVGKPPYSAKGWKIGYEAKVLITIGDVTREGTGHGSQVSKDLFDAIEGAAKEAETDAMKRAFMTWGNVFGLALYDKSRANVEDIEARQIREEIEQKKKIAVERAEQLYQEHMSKMMSFTSEQGDEAQKWWREKAGERKELNRLNATKAVALVEAMKKKTEEFKQNDNVENQ